VVNDSGYSNTITLGSGVSDKVTNSGGDTITLGNGAGDMVSTGNTLDDAGSTITLGNGADGSLNATIVPIYTCTSFNNPSSSYATDAFGINDLGQIVGRYESSTVPNAPSQDDAFLDSGDAFTSIAVPGAINFSTEAWGINDAGQIVGDYEDSTLSTQGFLYTGGHDKWSPLFVGGCRFPPPIATSTPQGRQCQDRQLRSARKARPARLGGSTRGLSAGAVTGLAGLGRHHGAADV
jgi:probable HAF family extracellular repeat protein